MTPSLSDRTKGTNAKISRTIDYLRDFSGDGESGMHFFSGNTPSGYFLKYIKADSASSATVNTHKDP
jgi:hypothetical protein